MLSVVAKFQYDAWTRFFLFLPVLLPLIYSNSLIFPYITTRTLFFVCVVEIALLCALLAFIFKQRTFSVSLLVLLFLAYSLWGLVVTLSDESGAISMWSYLDRMEGYYVWLHVFFFCVLVSWFFYREQWYQWIRYSFFVSVVVALMGFAQYAGNYDLTNNELRIDILFGNPIFFGLYILFHIGFGILLLREAKKNLYRYFYALIVALHILLLFFTGTRGAHLGLLIGGIVGFLVFAYLQRTRKRIRQVAFIVAAMVAGILLSLIFLNDSAFFTSNETLSRYSVISVTDLKNQSRYYIWEAALDGVRASPIFGHGYEQFEVVFEQNIEPSFYGKGLSSRPELWVDRTHNMFLDTAVSIGLPGVVLFLALISYAGYVYIRSREISDVERSILIGILAGYCVHSLFSFNVITGIVLIAFLVAYAHILDTKVRRYTIPTFPRWVRYIAIPLVFFVVGGALTVVWDRLHLSHQMQLIETATEPESRERLHVYHSLSENSYIDIHYVYGQIPVIASSLLQNHLLNEEERSAILTTVYSAEQKMRAMRALTPKDLYFLGTAYRLAGAYHDALRVLLQGTNEAPKRQVLLDALAMVYVDLGEYQKALHATEISYTLEPENRKSALMHAIALLYNEKIDESDEVLRAHYNSVYVASDELLEAQVHMELYDRALYTLTESVKHKPERIHHWDLLLSVHERTGDNENYNRTRTEMQAHHQ